MIITSKCMCIYLLFFNSNNEELKVKVRGSRKQFVILFVNIQSCPLLFIAQPYLEQAEKRADINQKTDKIWEMWTKGFVYTTRLESKVFSLKGFIPHIQ